MATTTIAGNQIKAGRALAGIDQAELGKAAGLQIQTVVRIERYRDRPVLSHNGTIAKVLVGLGAHGVLIVPGGAVKADKLTELVREMKTPEASGKPQQGLEDKGVRRLGARRGLRAKGAPTGLGGLY